MSDDQILTAEAAYANPDIVAGHGFRDERHAISRRAAVVNARAVGLILHPNPETFEELAIHVRVDHGRWIVDCPFCRGAQFASRDDPRFLCADCFNRAVGGQMLRVAWPDPGVQAAIDEQLLRRPNVANRNWLPHESVEDLAREFEEHADDLGAGPPILLDPITLLLARLEALEQRMAAPAPPGGD